MTSLSREHGAEQDLDAFAATVRAATGERLGRRPRDVALAELERALVPAAG